MSKKDYCWSLLMEVLGHGLPEPNNVQYRLSSVHSKKAEGQQGWKEKETDSRQYNFYDQQLQHPGGSIIHVYQKLNKKARRWTIITVISQLSANAENILDKLHPLCVSTAKISYNALTDKISHKGTKLLPWWNQCYISKIQKMECYNKETRKQERRENEKLRIEAEYHLKHKFSMHNPLSARFPKQPQGFPGSSCINEEITRGENME